MSQAWSFSTVNFNSFDVLFILNLIIHTGFTIYGFPTWPGLVWGIILLAGTMKEKEMRHKK